MFLIKILLVSLCGVFVESCRSSPPPPPPVKPLPAPKIVDVTLEYPDRFFVTWEGVPEDQVQKEYPILGYNLTLWADKRVKYRDTPPGGKPIYEYEIENSVLFGIVTPRIPVVSHGESASVIVGPDVRTAYYPMDPESTAQVRVKAFTAAGDGPFSFPETVRLLMSPDHH